MRGVGVVVHVVHGYFALSSVMRCPGDLQVLVGTLCQHQLHKYEDRDAVTTASCSSQLLYKIVRHRARL